MRRLKTRGTFLKMYSSGNTKISLQHDGNAQNQQTIQNWSETLWLFGGFARFYLMAAFSEQESKHTFSCFCSVTLASLLIYFSVSANCWSTRSIMMGWVFDCNRPLYLLYCSNKTFLKIISVSFVVKMRWTSIKKVSPQHNSLNGLQFVSIIIFVKKSSITMNLKSYTVACRKVWEKW